MHTEYNYVVLNDKISGQLFDMLDVHMNERSSINDLYSSCMYDYQKIFLCAMNESNPTMNITSLENKVSETIKENMEELWRDFIARIPGTCLHIA